MTQSNPSQFERLSNTLMRPVDASTLGAFRFFFGMLMVWEVQRFYFFGGIKQAYIIPKIYFPFEFFPFVTPWPGNGMYYHFAVIGVAALLLALGLFYRLSAAVFLLSYSYMFLIDKTQYNNHYYFICLLGFLFCFINADRWMSLDALWRKKLRTGAVPYWNVLIVKAQVFIVYFYGGIAKIGPDWLRGEPLRLWLLEPALRESTYPLVSILLQSEFGAYAFSYAALVFDLAIGFLLLCRKTRLLAFGLLLIFNLGNHWLFYIGVFPFLMIAAAVIFLEPETPRKFFKKFFPRIGEPQLQEAKGSPRLRKLAVAFVCIYLAIQVLLPFRHWLYEGNVNWTEEGHQFSWHMKLRHKGDCIFDLHAYNPETGENWMIHPKVHLTRRQFYKMCERPHMIIQYVHFVGKELEGMGIKNPALKVRARLSLNSRPSQDLIDPEANLMEKEYSTFRSADWIVPLEE